MKTGIVKYCGVELLGAEVERGGTLTLEFHQDGSGFCINSGNTCAIDIKADTSQFEVEYHDESYAPLIEQSKTIYFRGADRDPNHFTWNGKGRQDYNQLSHLGFTSEEKERAEQLAAPFNTKYNTTDDSSMSLAAKWMDKDGFIFALVDDLLGSTIDTVREKDLATYSPKK